MQTFFSQELVDELRTKKKVNFGLKIVRRLELVFQHDAYIAHFDM